MILEFAAVYVLHLMATWCVRCRPPAVVEDDYELPPPGKPEVLADIDYAHVIGLCAQQPDQVPSWYSDSLGAELRRSQVCTVLIHQLAPSPNEVKACLATVSRCCRCYHVMLLQPVMSCNTSMHLETYSPWRLICPCLPD